MPNLASDTTWNWPWEKRPVTIFWPSPFSIELLLNIADRSFESSHVHLQKVSKSIKKSHHGGVDPNVVYPHLTSAEAKPLLAPVVAWTTLSRRWSACQVHRVLGAERC
jgi:hypothetical protein